ncbi:uncharacterized protein LOC144621957 [Crassostrea virginica]
MQDGLNVYMLVNMNVHFKEKPSNIRFSQDSIAGYWKIENTPIGETLDKLLLGKIDINDIPIITVHSIGGHLYSSDNRRLWVFKQLETLGKCEKIKVEYSRRNINPRKFTTQNNGVSIQIRGARGPGGIFWKQWKNSSPVRDEDIVGSGKQSDSKPSSRHCYQDSTDFSAFSPVEIETSTRAEDIWYCQNEIVSDGKYLGDVLDSFLSYDWSRYYYNLKVFRKGLSFFTSKCITLWVLKNLEKFGVSPEIRLTVIDSPSQQNGHFLRKSLVFTPNLQIGGTEWKDIEFLKNLRTLKTIETDIDDIYFTRALISDTYENKSIAKILADCNATMIVPERLRVVKFRDRYYALNNEVLWVLKEVQKVEGPLCASADVKIEMDEVLFKSFTSDDINEVEIKPSGFKHTNEEAFILKCIKKKCQHK